MSNNELATTPLGNIVIGPNTPTPPSLPNIGIGYPWARQGYRAYLIATINSIPYSHQTTRYIRQQLTEFLHNLEEL